MLKKTNARKSFILPCYVNCLFHGLVHIFKLQKRKKSLAVDGLPGGDNPHSHGAWGPEDRTAQASWL